MKKNTHSRHQFLSIPWIRFFLIIISFIGLNAAITGQMHVDQSNSLELLPERLIRNTFIGQGVKVESIKFFGTENAIGVFRNAEEDMGIDRGVVISTGEVKTLAMSNNDDATGSSTSNRTVKDDELAAVAGEDLFDVAVIEIKFRPNDDLIGFNYVFGSEEYPEYVCSDFNDVFAFFISGPNPSGGSYTSHNIARVPEPSDPSGETFTDFPVTINSVNTGEIGEVESNSDCTGEGESLEFSQYFNMNHLSRSFTLDGYLDVFKAKAEVIPCELYTLRLAIGDGFDDAFDSAVFLEAKSFSSAMHTVSVQAPGVDYSMMEGCDPIVIDVTRVDGSSSDIDIDFEIISGPNSAVRGEDYTLSTNDLYIAEGETSAQLIINALNDEIEEEEEFVYVVFRNSQCLSDTLRVEILERVKPQFSVPNDTMLCEGDQIFLESGDVRQLEVREKSGEIPIGDTLRGDCRSTILVSDSDVKYLNSQSLVQVCIDMLEHQNMADMEIFLSSPDGQLVELSTNNGEDGGNGDGLDLMINTCFTLNADNFINGGNDIEGPFLENNPTYTGNFAPEQDFSALFDGFYSPVNGQWTLIIRDDQNPELTGILYQWSLKLNPKFQETRRYKIGDQELIGSPILIESSSELQQDIEHNYGCSYSNTSNIIFNPLPSQPIVNCGNPRRNQILLDWDDMDADEYEVKRENDTWIVINNSEYLFENLTLDGNYTFEVRAVKNGCLGPSDILSCGTPPCAESEIVIESLTPVSSYCTEDASVTFSVNSNDGPFDFQLGGENNSSGTFSGLKKGRERVFAIDVYGCALQKTFDIEGPDELDLSMTAKKVSCDQDIRGTASVKVTGGTEPYTYSWNNGGDEAIIKRIERGTYTVLVTDAQGCTQTAEVEVENGSIPVAELEQEDVKCHGLATGSVIFDITGGEGPFEYRWNDGFATVLPERKGLRAGDYVVKIEDRNQCYTIENVTITEPEAFSIGIDKEDNLCYGVAEGLAKLNLTGGTPPYQIIWSNGSNQSAIGNLKKGEYGVTVTDDGGCTAKTSFEITEPSELFIDFEETPITCHDGENGSLLARAVGPGDYIYKWENGRTFQTINNLARGRYCVTVSDGNGCEFSDCYVMEHPESMELDIITQDITCYQSEDGSFLLNITGGKAPYDIELNGESRELDDLGLITSLTAGSYVLKITDNTGCIVSELIEIKEASEPSLVLEVQNLECTGEKSGSIFLRYLNEPDAPITWYDNDGNLYEGHLLNELESGEYHYQILTNIGCKLRGTVEIEEPENPLTLSVEQQDISCFGDRNGLIQLSGAGGDGTYLYSVNGSGFQRSGIYNGLSEGTYKTFVKDGNGCEFLGEEITITEPEALKVKLPSDTIVDRGVDLPVTMEIQGGKGNLMYQWTITNQEDIMCLDCEDQWVNNVKDDFALRVDVEDDNLCMAFDEMRVFVIKDYQMYVPTGFSPNGDARNEILNVFGPDFAFIKEFNIYLKNGTNIYNEYNFRPNNMLKGWDGTFRGKIMPAGVYIWTMHVEYDDGANESFKGSVQLIR